MGSPRLGDVSAISSLRGKDGALSSSAYVEVEYVWEHPLFPERPQSTKVLVSSPLPSSDDDFPEWTVLGKDVLEGENEEEEAAVLAETKNIVLTPSAVMREDDGSVVVLCEAVLVDPSESTVSKLHPEVAQAWAKKNAAPSLDSLARRVNNKADADNDKGEMMEIDFETADTIAAQTSDRGDGCRSVPLFHTRNASKQYDTLMRSEKGSVTPGPKMSKKWRLGGLSINTKSAEKRFAYNPESGEYSPLTPRSRFLRSVNERRSDSETYMSSVGRTSHFVRYVNGQEDEVAIGKWLMGQKQGTASCFDAPSPVPFEVLMNELIIQQRLSSMSSALGKTASKPRVKR